MTTGQLISTEQAESDAQIVATSNGFSFTRGELRSYFELVEDKTNWKNPINKSLEMSLFGQRWAQGEDDTRSYFGIIEAIKFFAGCNAKVKHTSACRREGDRIVGTVIFRAIGYYAAVGA